MTYEAVTGDVSPDHCAELFLSGEAFQAMHDWFSLDEVVRLQAIDDAVVAVKDNGVNMRDNLKYPDGLDQTQCWTLRNIGALTSPLAATIFTLDTASANPDGISREAFDEFQFELEDPAFYAFEDATERVAAAQGEQRLKFKLHPEMDDFAEPQRLFYDMPTDQMGILLGYLADHLPPDHDFFNSRRVKNERLGGEIEVGELYMKVVPPVRDIDLISDDELMRKLPNAAEIFRLDRMPMYDWIEQFLSFGKMPKAKTLAKLMIYNGETAQPEAQPWQPGKSITMGAYYHALLRRAVNVVPTVEDMTDVHTPAAWHVVGPEKFEETISAVADYLMDDTIMQHYLPYLKTEKYFEDVIVRITNYFEYNDGWNEPKLEGPEAVERKRKDFAGVVKTVHDNLVKLGENERAEQLRNRVIDGVVLADFL